MSAATIELEIGKHVLMINCTHKSVLDLIVGYSKENLKHYL